MARLSLIRPRWPAPATVHALATTRQGGVSRGPWEGLNLGLHVEGDLSPDRLGLLREVFDVPDLALTDDSIVNGTFTPRRGESRPLALFTAPRIDYSLHRLGMGGGYYDRTLAALRDGPGPLLLGVGYDLQCVETVQPQPWDIAADYIFTEACTYQRENEA